MEIHSALASFLHPSAACGSLFSLSQQLREFCSCLRAPLLLKSTLYKKGCRSPLCQSTGGLGPTSTRCEPLASLDGSCLIISDIPGCPFLSHEVAHFEVNCQKSARFFLLGGLGWLAIWFVWDRWALEWYGILLKNRRSMLQTPGWMFLRIEWKRSGDSKTCTRNVDGMFDRSSWNHAWFIKLTLFSGILYIGKPTQCLEGALFWIPPSGPWSLSIDHQSGLDSLMRAFPCFFAYVIFWPRVSGNILQAYVEPNS